MNTATSGTLSFTTSATASSPIGSYTVNGGSLTVNNGNYVFVQAPGNTVALTIKDATKRNDVVVVDADKHSSGEEK